jgi:hypothetical protein
MVSPLYKQVLLFLALSPTNKITISSLHQHANIPATTSDPYTPILPTNTHTHVLDEITKKTISYATGHDNAPPHVIQLLLPFTIDPNGILCPTAHNFLFGIPTEDDFPDTFYSKLPAPC